MRSAISGLGSVRAVVGVSNATLQDMNARGAMPAADARAPRSVTIGIAGVPVSVESEIPLVLELAAARFPAAHGTPLSRLVVHAGAEDGVQDLSIRWQV